MQNKPTVAMRRLESPKLHTTTYLQVMRNLMLSARYKLQIQSSKQQYKIRNSGILLQLPMGHMSRFMNPSTLHQNFRLKISIELIRTDYAGNRLLQWKGPRGCSETLEI
jgi:hypothetical protein